MSTMRALCPIVFVLAFGTFLNQVVIVPQRKERISLISQIVGCVLNIVLNFLFIPLWGVLGAAIATLIVESVIMLIKAVYCAETFVSWSVFVNLAKSLAATAVMGMAGHFTLIAGEAHESFFRERFPQYRTVPVKSPPFSILSELSGGKISSMCLPEAA